MSAIIKADMDDALCVVSIVRGEIVAEELALKLEGRIMLLSVCMRRQVDFSVFGRGRVEEAEADWC